MILKHLFLRILLILILNYCLVMADKCRKRELEIITPAGTRHLLSGYSAHESLIKHMFSIYENKLKLAIENFLKYSTKNAGMVLSNLGIRDYVFLQFLYSMKTNDVVFSNQLLEIFSHLKNEKGPPVSSWSKLNFQLPQEEIYNLFKSIANFKGLIEPPQIIIKELFLLANNPYIVIEAFKKDDTEILYWFLEKGMDLNLTSILQEACDRKNWNFIQKLLSNKRLVSMNPDLNTVEEVCKEALLSSASGVHSPKTIELLLETGVKLNSFDSNGFTPLYIAAKSRDLDTVKILIEEGADVNLEVKSGDIPLHAAVKSGHFHISEMLINSKSVIDKKNYLGLTPLHIAEQIGVNEVIKSLIERNITIVLTKEDKELSSLITTFILGINKTSNERKLLHSEILVNISNIAELLLNHGGKKNLNSNIKTKLLKVVAKDGNVNLLQTLIKLGADVTFINENNETLLFDAVKDGNNDVINFLLEQGIDVNKEDIFGNSASHIAAKYGNPITLQLLDKRGANFEAKNTNKRTPLHEAAEAGRLLNVQYLIDKGISIDELDIEHKTPLILAAGRGHDEILKVLINKTVNCQLVSMSGQTALHYAASRGYTRCVVTLLSCGLSVNKLDNDHQTPLYMAATGGHEEVVRTLLSKGADCNLRTKTSGWSTLHSAAREGWIPIVNLLLNMSADVNSQNIDNKTPLFEAAYYGQKDVVKLLLSKGADLTMKTKSDGLTALHIASAKGHNSVINQILNSGGNINVKDFDNRTPLFEAAYQGNSGTVSLLLDRCADIQVQTKSNGWSPLHVASINGDIVSIKGLLSEGIDVDVKANDDKTSLMDASWWGRDSAVVLLLDKGANITAQSKAGGWTSFHFAAARNHISVMKIFMDRGVDVNLRSTNGHTPLLDASYWDSKEAVKLLLDKGADFNLASYGVGWSPLHTAAHKGNVKIVEMLLNKGMDVNSKTAMGTTALMEASRYGKDDVVKVLLRRGANMTVRSNEGGWTSLHYAAQKGAIGVINILLDNGIDINIKNIEEKTPLYESVYWGHFEASKILIERGADVTAKTSFGESLITLAKTRNQKSIASLLSGKCALSTE